MRPGRRVQELAAELTAGEQTIVRASALRVQAVSGEVAGQAAGDGAEARARADAEPMPPPSSGKPLPFTLNDSSETSFAGTAMEMRWLNDPWQLGPGRVWSACAIRCCPASSSTPLARLAASADFGNGVSAALPFDRFLFINADLAIHLQRPPRGEWIGLDARTLLHEGGAALAESVLHDEHGPVARAFQTLVVQAR